MSDKLYTEDEVMDALKRLYLELGMTYKFKVTLSHLDTWKIANLKKRSNHGEEKKKENPE